MFEEIRKVIDEGKRFLITTHLNPDGDAFGSSLALQQVLNQLGKEARIIHRQEVPLLMNQFQDCDLWNQVDSLPPEYPGSWDAIFTVECPKPERTGFDNLLDGFVINIDHHISNQKYGDINLVDADIPCVGMLIWKLAVECYGLSLTQSMAEQLYVALVTDTGQFCYANATEECFRMAAQLVEHGVRPDRISAYLYEGYPPSVVKLKGLILSTLMLYHEGKIALVEFPRNFLDEAEAREEDAEGVIDEPRKIKGVAVSVLLKELSDGMIKVSMRSQGHVNVENIASRYGGGGHHNAAGFTVTGSLATTRDMVLSELTALINP